MIRFAMDKRYEEALLFDFYGELLTDKQKAVFEEAYVYDCSLSEIAEEHGISRQGVHDMLKRSQKTLADYETKLGLVRKFLAIRAKVEKIRQANGSREIDGLCAEILEEL